MRSQDYSQEYRIFTKYNIEEIQDKDFECNDDEFVSYDEHYAILDKINIDVKNIIDIIKKDYDLKEAIDMLEILLEKVY